MKSNRLIVVLGMHRSGTSAITRGLKVLGVNLGDTLYGPMKDVNEKGFWEDVHLNSLNVEILDFLGSNWDHFSTVTKGDLAILRNEGYFLRAVELLREKISSPVFGIKDPRLAKLLPFWKEVFDYCQFDVSYVLAVRHPLSVVKSLSKRDGFDSRKSYLLWLGHVISSLTGSAGNKRVIVDYDFLMLSPEHELMRIAERLNLVVDGAELEKYIVDFLDRDLQHTIYHLQDLPLDPTCPPLVHEVYASLLEVASDHVQIDDPALNQKIENWATEFERNSVALAFADSLGVQKTATEQAVIECEEQIARLNEVLSERDGQIVSFNQMLSERERQIASLNQAVTERESQIACLGRSINDIHESTSWRVTAPLRSAVTTIRKVHSVISVLPQALMIGGGLWSTSWKAVRVCRKEGIPGVKHRLRFVFRQSTIGMSNTETSIAQNLQIVSPKPPVIPYYIEPKVDEDESELDVEGASVAIHIHLFYAEMLEEFVSRLRGLKANFDLYVSVPHSVDAATVQATLTKMLPQAGAIVVEIVPNRGRDIAPLIIQFGARLADYDVIGHFHTKKSPHGSSLSNWCSEILNCLLGHPNNPGGRVAHFIGMLQGDAAIIYPEGNLNILKDSTGWAANYELARTILERYSTISIADYMAVEFSEGSMFWARAESLRNFLLLPLTYNDFPPEPIPADGTIAHALERLLLIFASQHGRKCYRIHKGDSIHDYRLYETQRDYSQSLIHCDIKVLTYYLPQFHSIPENDLWHGKGFTEWTKVKAANPLFEGHYQQHIPHSDIGYYLLDSPDTLRRQAEQMKKAGVHGQVFYHYWFTGKLILEEPAQLLLNTPDIRMPFCFCWANENWTRRWDGNENEILLEQNYSAQDAHEFIQYLIPFFKDHRYITVEDRPVLFVYRPSSIPNSQEYLDIWAEECAREGVKQPYVIAVLTRGATHPKDFGMDAGVERVLHDWTAGGAPEIKDGLNSYWPIKGSVLSYDDVANFYMAQTEERDFTYFRSLVPIWDNTARYGSEAYLLHGSTPQRFQEWMESTVAYTQATLPPDRRFVLVNAWNEWAEGAHIEPDSRFGYSYLNAVGRALSGIKYATELNPNSIIPSGFRVHISISEDVRAQLQNEGDLRNRFISCLKCSTIFDIALVSSDAVDLLQGLPWNKASDPNEIDVLLQFRRVAFFDSRVIEKMIKTACHCPDTVVIPNSYDRGLPEIMENGSVHSYVAYSSPFILFPARGTAEGYKNYRMRSDAHCFVVYPNTQDPKSWPAVTTIIRFHKSASIAALKNALYCLAAMQNCAVTPLIAAQDLDESQKLELMGALREVPFVSGIEPLVHFYYSPDGKGDFRSKMLNESLRAVKTRYAAFLDYDDLVMPHAYIWLINRLHTTRKAISFGRVFKTTYDGTTGLFISREREYEVGNSYDEFLMFNHAPLHSFILDLSMLDIAGTTYYEDQRYMEDYFLMLQIITRDNADWDILSENVYIGDYIHSVDREHTLAFSDITEREALFSNPEYIVVEQRIRDMQESIKSRDAK